MGLIFLMDVNFKTCLVFGMNKIDCNKHIISKHYKKWERLQDLIEETERRLIQVYAKINELEKNYEKSLISKEKYEKKMNYLSKKQSYNYGEYGQLLSLKFCNRAKCANDFEKI